MGKEKRKKNQPKKTNKKKEELTKIYISVIPLTLILFLVIFMFIQYLGEISGILPIISLYSEIFTIGESVALFGFSLSLSITLALIITFLLLKRVNK